MNLRPPQISLGGLLIGGLAALGTYLLFRRSIEQAVENIRQPSLEKTGQGLKAYMPLVREVAARNNIPASILAGVVSAESSWSNLPTPSSADCRVACIASNRCAIGIAQVLPTTAAEVGVTDDLCIPTNSLVAGARYLRRLFTKYRARMPNSDDREVWNTAIQAYNAGPGNVDRGDVGSKTRDYTAKVLRNADRYQEQGLAGLGAVSPRSYVAPRPRFLALRIG